jgi:hypothetical protein
MQTEWIRRNTGSPSGDRGRDQLATRKSQAGSDGVAERSVVPTKDMGIDDTSSHPESWVQQLQTASHGTSWVFSESRMR